MTMTRALIDPLDTMFFSEGLPFSQDDEGLTEAISSFPPLPTSFAGAVRAAIARQNKWDGISRWDEELVSLLGNGPLMSKVEDDPTDKRISFGPLALQISVGDITKEYWPAPSALLTSTKPASGVKKMARAMRPEVIDGVITDAGRAIALLDKDVGEDVSHATSSNLWIERKTFLKFLNGQANPGNLLEGAALFGNEHRIGLGIDHENARKHARDGRLYAASHTRLRAFNKDPSFTNPPRLTVCIAGLPSDKRPTGSHPFGGRGRSASIEFRDTDGGNGFDAFGDAHAFATAGRCLVVTLSPSILGDKPTPFCDLPGIQVETAAHGRARRFAPWDSDRHQRTELLWMIPSGACWWLRYEQSEGLNLYEHLARQGANAGRNSEDAFRVGFGAVALGIWP